MDEQELTVRVEEIDNHLFSMHDTVNHAIIKVDKWVDYNTIVTDETLQKFIKDYVSKNFSKEEYSVSIHNECYCESLL